MRASLQVVVGRGEDEEAEILDAVRLRLHRAAECFCTGPAECRCSPPCGNVYVKKKLYKADGEEKVEKVPTYEVKMVPAEPCTCARCAGVCWWNPLSVLHYLAGH